ncbi:MAG TPA: YceI family protein [Bacteroidia bacterium]|jgi:polyisoprenoid-binding protein YceI|nr:YceI family protein [Bacteroidia bacterium]
MKSPKFFVLCVTIGVLTLLFAFRFINVKWNVDVTNAKIHFSVPKGNKEGTLGGLVATVDFDAAHPELAQIKATIDVNTINTGIDKLNEHLKTPDFFDAKNHPLITFTAESVAKTDTGFVAMGKLAMRDSIHEVSIPFNYITDDKGNATMKGRLDLYSGDYGVGKKSPTGNDEVIIDIEVPLLK